MKMKFENCIDINTSLCSKSVTNRAVIVAVFDKEGRIRDNLVEYLKELKQFSDYIVVVGDNPIFKEDISKLNGLADHIIFKRHEEYDFGSYKRGFNLLRKKDIFPEGKMSFFELLFKHCGISPPAD